MPEPRALPRWPMPPLRPMRLGWNSTTRAAPPLGPGRRAVVRLFRPDVRIVTGGIAPNDRARPMPGGAAMTSQKEADKHKVVTEAVNDTLKAIAASLLMEQVLAPRFEFKPKNPQSEPTPGFDYGEEGYKPGETNVGFNHDTGQFQIEI